jgi:hypothetical protein
MGLHENVKIPTKVLLAQAFFDTRLIHFKPLMVLLDQVYGTV